LLDRPDRESNQLSVLDPPHIVHKDLHPGRTPRTRAPFVLVAAKSMAGGHDRQQQCNEGKGAKFSRMKMLVNHRSKANEPKRNEPEQPARTLANTAIVVRLEGIEDQQTDAQEKAEALDGLHRQLSLQHTKERNQENRRQTEDAVVPQEEVK